MIKSVSAVLLLAMTLTAAAATENVHSIAQAVDEHYNHLHTLQADSLRCIEGRE